MISIIRKKHFSRIGVLAFGHCFETLKRRLSALATDAKGYLTHVDVMRRAHDKKSILYVATPWSEASTSTVFV